jgi:hypothetical protein
MEKKGSPALMVFVVLSLGGILALFSQVNVSTANPAALQSFDAPAGEAELFRETLPSALEAGAAGHEAFGAASLAPDSGSQPRRKLSLRCK